MRIEAAVLTGDLIGSTDAQTHAVEETMRLLKDMAIQISPSTHFTRFRGDGWQIYLESPGKSLFAILFLWAGLRAARCLESRIALGLGAAPTSLKSNALAEGPQQTQGPKEDYIPSLNALAALTQTPKRNALALIGHPKPAKPGLNALAATGSTLAATGLSGIMGEAFTASGRALDQMGKLQLLAIAGSRVDPLHKRLFSMIEDQISAWSFEQSEAMRLAFLPNEEMTQASMANHLKISRQAVAARLQSGGYQQLHGAAVDFERTFGDGKTK